MTRYLARPPGSTYEHPDAPVWPIVKFLCWIAVSAVVIHFGLGFVSALMIDQAMEVGERPYLPSVTQDEQRLLESDGWINKDAGRDHWPDCYSVVTAGGGMKPGTVFGASSRHSRISNSASPP